MKSSDNASLLNIKVFFKESENDITSQTRGHTHRKKTV